MRPHVMVIVGAALLLGLSAGVAAQDSLHEQALAAIRKLGGSVIEDRNSPGTPVSIVLTGSADPAKCLSYLKDVSNLHRCDL